MNKIYELDECKINDRNGTYGGQAGDKEGIIFNGENWIVKYPKSTRGMDGDLISYMTAPLSEYIGSHIYSILGYDVHDTILGMRNDKIVVACKDFCNHVGDLREVRTLKNIYNKNITEAMENSFSSTSSSHLIDIDEILLHLEYNPILSKIDGIKERFWDCVVVDVLINNNDRNNGNWGVLYENGKYVMAPVFDNGAAFTNKYKDERLVEILKSEERMRMSSLKTVTVYGTNDKQILAQQIVKIDNSDLKKSLKKNVPLIQKNMSEIKRFIMDIPEEYKGKYVCSAERKHFYLRGMELRFEEIIKPALQIHCKNENILER